MADRKHWLTRLALVCAACMDAEVLGEALNVVDAPSEPIEPGKETDIAFQALDANGKGAPDQDIEILITDTSRLGLASDVGANRAVVRTSDDVKVQGANLQGAVVVHFVVPEDAAEGEVSVIASLEGDRGGNSAKTRWIDLTIRPAGGSGGAGGTSSTGGTGDSSVGGTAQ
jgi:hypothetical protein